MSINSKDTESQQTTDVYHPKAKISCRVHKGYEVDSICFHSTCRESANQLLCAMCGNSQQPHRNHQTEVFPIYKTSPGFKLLNSIADEKLAKFMISQKQIITKELDLFTQAALNMIEELKKNVERKFECLWGLPSSGSVFKVCQMIKGEGISHQRCCISIINAFKSFEEKSSDPQGEAKNFLAQFVHQQVIQSVQKLHNLLEDLKNFGVLSQTLNKSLQIEKENEDINKFEEENVDDINNSKIKQEISLKFQATGFNNPCLNSRKKSKSFIKSTVRFVQQPSLNISKLNTDKKSLIRSMKKKNKINKNVAINCSNSRLDIQPLNRTINQVNLSLPRRLEKSVANLALIPNGLDMIDANSVAFWRPLSIDEQIAANQFLKQRQNITNLLFQQMNYKKDSYKKYFKNILCDVKIENLYFDFRVSTRKIISYFLQTEKKIKNLNIGDNFRYLRRIDQKIFFKKYNFSQQCKKIIYKKLFVFPIKNSNKFSYLNDKANLEINEALQQLALYGTLNVDNVNNNLANLKKLKILALNKLVLKSTKLQLRKILQNNPQLHTFSIMGISTCISKKIQELVSLSRYQLKHLNISALKSQRAVYINLSMIKYHVNLETLILVNLKFAGNQKLQEQSINSLNQLTYLNLYGCEPVNTAFVNDIHSDCRSMLKMMNLGCTYIDQKTVRSLSKFTNLESLCLDYTDINSNDLLNITLDMAKLRNLSIYGLKEEMNPSRTRDENSWQPSNSIDSVFFSAMKWKNFRYVSIYLSEDLGSYDWRSFRFLEVLRVNNASLIKENIRNQLHQRRVMVIDSLEDQIASENTSHANIQQSFVEVNNYRRNQMSQDLQETQNREFFKRESQSDTIQ